MENSRHRRARSARLALRYEAILGTTGPVGACDGQQGRGGICKYAVAVNAKMGRMRDSVKNARRRRAHIRAPKTQRRNKKYTSRRFIKHGTYCKGPDNVRRYFCKKYTHTFSRTPGFKGRHYKPATIRRAPDDHIYGKSLRRVVAGLAVDDIDVSHTAAYRCRVSRHDRQI